MKKYLAAVACVVLVSAGPVLGAGDPEAGREKATACAACHGPDGNSFNPAWPKLAGQHEGIIVKQLKDFQAGVRQDPLMSPMAAPLTDQDMLDLAAFFASQPKQIGEADPGLVAEGEQLYRGGNLATGVAACAACHTPSGIGNPAANFPRLGGQHAAYTAKALRDFRSSERSNDAAQMMRNVASRMTDAEIEAVASYIQGLN
jgi:cytochrome c553